MRDICCHFNLYFVHSLGKEFKSCEFVVLGSLNLSPTSPRTAVSCWLNCPRQGAGAHPHKRPRVRKPGSWRHTLAERQAESGRETLQGGREVLSLLLGEKAVWPPGGNVTAVVNPGATLEAVLMVTGRIW